MAWPSKKCVLVTGGAGYVGAVLVPKLLAAGWRVKVLDWYLYGDEVLSSVASDPRLKQIKGDLRDGELVARTLDGCDAVIHLACISNDPSAELNAAMTQSVNFDCFEPLVKQARKSGVERFIYASSSSVYGISEKPNVDETHELKPLTDYSKYKCLCEPIVLSYASDSFVPVVIRPATVCGDSPRLRLDLTVNILTNHAVNKGKITVFGGTQMRPNIHIQDITDLYVQLLAEPAVRISGKTWNAGYHNHTVSQIALIVKSVVEKMMPEKGTIEIVTTPTDDNRSYHVNSDLIARELGFTPKHTIENAVVDLVKAFQAGRIPNSMQDDRYYNVKRMSALGDRLLTPMAETSLALAR